MGPTYANIAYFGSGSLRGTFIDLIWVKPHVTLVTCCHGLPNAGMLRALAVISYDTNICRRRRRRCCCFGAKFSFVLHFVPLLYVSFS